MTVGITLNETNPREYVSPEGCVGTEFDFSLKSETPGTFYPDNHQDDSPCLVDDNERIVSYRITVQ